MEDQSITRRRLVAEATSLAFVPTAGCLGAPAATEEDLGPDGQPSPDTADDGGANGESQPPEPRVEIPNPLPTELTVDDYIDFSGQSLVEVETREGDDDEPNYVFDPPFVLVEQNTTIRWRNRDGEFHTVTSTPTLEQRTGGGAVFDAEIVDEGDTFEWEATQPGRQHYYCLPHTGFMWGSIGILTDEGELLDEPAHAPPEPEPEEEEADEAEEEPEPDAVYPEELPTDPEPDDFVDMTGESIVEIETRHGVEGEPSFLFDPPFVRVDHGTTIRWVNTDGVFHTVTSTPSLDRRTGGGATFDAQIAAVGDTFEWEASESGRQSYYCSPHAGFMYGAIEVE